MSQGKPPSSEADAATTKDKSTDDSSAAAVVRNLFLDILNSEIYALESDCRNNRFFSSKTI